MINAKEMKRKTEAARLTNLVLEKEKALKAIEDSAASGRDRAVLHGLSRETVEDLRGRGFDVMYSYDCHNIYW